MLSPFIDCKIHKRCSRLGMYRPRLCPDIHSVQTRSRFYNGYLMMELCHKIIYTHKIVHYSAMYFQKLNVIHKYLLLLLFLHLLLFLLLVLVLVLVLVLLVNSSSSPHHSHYAFLQLHLSIACPLGTTQ